MNNNEAIARLQAAADIAIATGCELAKMPAMDALAIAELLKEQEPIAPKKPKTMYAYEFACGNCEACVDIEWIVCPWCGRRIKWDADD